MYDRRKASRRVRRTRNLSAPQGASSLVLLFALAPAYPRPAKPPLPLAIENAANRTSALEAAIVGSSLTYSSYRREATGAVAEGLSASGNRRLCSVTTRPARPRFWRLAGRLGSGWEPADGPDDSEGEEGATGSNSSRAGARSSASPVGRGSGGSRAVGASDRSQAGETGASSIGHALEGGSAGVLAGASARP
jgi:hypothetical protein